MLLEIFIKFLLNPAAAAAAKLLQSCPTLCDPIDGSPSGSTIPGILQARTLEWVAISFSMLNPRDPKSALCSWGFTSIYIRKTQWSSVILTFLIRKRKHTITDPLNI